MEIDLVGEKVIGISPGQTILEASLSAGIAHFHACGGMAKCSTCRVLVLQGKQHLSTPNKRELGLKSRVELPDTVRLACQTHVTGGSVKVERMVKDRSDVLSLAREDEKRPGRFRLLPLGQERNLVLFFLDIRNFTSFVETHLPFDVIYAMRKLFETFYQVILSNGGEIVETAGDEIYAVFGMRTSIKVAADAAIAAGFNILSELDDLNSTYEHVFQRRFEIGIGIHSGRVVTGKIQFGDTAKLSTVGLAVNVASRIQRKTKEINNSFLASELLIRESSYPADGPATMIKLDGVTMPVFVYPLGKAYGNVVNGVS